MKVSQSCINLIKQFEGCKLTPYICPAGLPTIGFGSTRYADGRKVSLGDPKISQAEADKLLMDTIVEYEQGVNKAVAKPLTQNQFDALVDFAYNTGVSKMQQSTLIKKVVAGDFVGAKAEFGKWVYGGGKVLPGLVKRRAAEAELFGKP